MCCHVRSASASRRRRQLRRPLAPPLPLAVLDLSKLSERQAHDFLCRATSKREGMWKLLDVHRHGDVLLCLVRWVHPNNSVKPFSLAEVSLTERAVCWRDHATPEAARAEMERCCTRSQRCLNLASGPKSSDPLRSKTDLASSREPIADAQKG
jgi:hypothetical protein